MGKVKSGVKSVKKSVNKGLKQIDPTTKDGLLNIATMGQYGMAKHGIGMTKKALGMEEPDAAGETASEKEAANIAIKEYDFAREMDFVKDEYANRIERLGSNEMKDAVAGRANINAQNQSNMMINNTESSLNQAGIDPSSGRATSAMGEAYNTAGDAIGNSKSQAEFALDSSHLEGRNNRIAMAMGEKTKAVAGLQDIARGANQVAINKAQNKFNSNAATVAAIGSAAGMAGQAYIGRDKTPAPAPVKEE